MTQERLNLVSAKGLQMIIDFWSDINEVERAPSESIQCDVLAYLEEIKRLQAIEAERDRYKTLIDSVNEKINYSHSDPNDICADIQKMLSDLNFKGADTNE